MEIVASDAKSATRTKIIALATSITLLLVLLESLECE